MLVKVVPPSVLTCHCTVSALPVELATVKEALCPVLTVRLAGCVVTKSTVKVAADVVTVPALLVNTASYSSLFCAAVAVNV